MQTKQKAANRCDLAAYEAPPAGFEPATPGLGTFLSDSVNGGTVYFFENSALGFSRYPARKDNRIQHDLVKIINRWPSLSEDVRSAILFLVDGSAELSFEQ